MRQSQKDVLGVVFAVLLECVLMCQCRSSGKRSLNSIARNFPPERDVYHGGPQTKDREEEKQKLINLV